MKSIHTAVVSVLLSFTPVLWAQTADDYIAQGESYLAATNLIGANNSFSNAVILSPNNPTGNVLYAATRLLVLPYTTPGSNFLNRLGVPVDGRNVYKWTAQLATDTNGVPLAPQGVNATEATALLRTNILSALSAAQANLASVSDTNFLLSLSSQQTELAALQIDYGDVLLLRAILEAGIYFGYTLNSWNFDAQLTAVRSLYLSDGLSPTQLLEQYPELFTFSTTNDLSLAKTTFSNAVSLYLQASAFIRARPIDETRLFNLDVAKANKEDDLRQLLTGLQSALEGPVRLDVGYHLIVNLAPLFDGSHPLRPLIPEFSGTNYVLGTLDPTFEGIITGLDPGAAETFLAKYFPPVTQFSTDGSLVQNHFLVQLNVLPGHGYAIESSTDLINWSPLAHEFATNTTLTLADPVAGGSRVFYRAHEESNDRFAHAYAIDGFPASAFGSSEGATPEPGDPTNYFNQVFGTGTPVWWVWTAPVSGEVGVAAAGTYFDAVLGVFTGNTLAQLTPVVNLAANSPNPNEFDFQATAGTSYFIAVESGYYFQQGNITLTLAGLPANDNFDNRQVLTGTTVSVNGCNILATEEPNESSGGGHSVWYSWTAPSAGSVTLSATGTAYPSANVYVGSDLTSLVQVAGGSALNFDATAGVTYQIQVDSYNAGNFTLGLTFFAGRYPLFLSIYPSEGGTVLLQPPPDSNGMYAAGTSVTLTAKVASGFLLGGWTGSVTANGSVTQITLAMNGSQSLYVSFYPLNDNFVGSTVVSGDNFTLQGTTDGASNEPNEPGFLYGTVWYSWTAPASGSTTIWFRNPYYAQLNIYTGSQLTNLTPVSLFSVGSLHGVTSQTFDATAGTTYHIQIGGYAPTFTLMLESSENFYALAESAFPAAGGTILVSPPPDSNGLYPAGTNVNLTAEPAPGFFFGGWSGSVNTGGSTPALTIVMNGSQRLLAAFYPVNDAFTDRIQLLGTNTITNGTTAGASSEAGEACIFCQTVWYSWTAPVSGSVTFSLSSTGPFNMNFYTGNQLNTLVPVSIISQGSFADSITETFNAIAGTTYEIQIDAVGTAFQLGLNL